MRNKFLLTMAFGLSIASMVAVAEDAKKGNFTAQLEAISSSGTASHTLKNSTGYIPAYSIRVNNNSASFVTATAYGNGGSKTFGINPHFSATIQNEIYSSVGYRIRIDTPYGVYDGFVRSLACIDVYAGERPYVTDNCLQPY